MTSLGKKYIMAVTGLILVGFVIGHMLGNLQMFLHPDWMNAYAYKLQNLPYGLLWIVRLGLLAAVLAHVVTAVLLVLENRRARPQGYSVNARLQATFASKTMRYSGVILLAFIVFHLLHFTVRSTHGEVAEAYYAKAALEGVWTFHGSQEMAGKAVPDVFSMVAVGFSPRYWYVSLFYIVAMGLLFLHLSHGISSMFQSLGLRNHVWRGRLDRAAVVIAVALFIGFASIPLIALAGLLPHQELVQFPSALMAKP